MRRRMLFLVTALGITLGITGCRTFEGVAGDPGETYTTNLNIPGQRIVPYNDPHIDANEPPDEVEVCEGILSKNGFKCEP